MNDNADPPSTLDTSRAPHGERAAAELVQAVTRLGDLAERHYLELKGPPDLNSKTNKAKVAKFILGAANRMPDRAGQAFEGYAVMIVGITANGIVGLPPLERLAARGGEPVEGGDVLGVQAVGGVVVGVLVTGCGEVGGELLDGQGWAQVIPQRSVQAGGGPRAAGQQGVNVEVVAGSSPVVEGAGFGRCGVGRVDDRTKIGNQDGWVPAVVLA